MAPLPFSCSTTTLNPYIGPCDKQFGDCRHDLVLKLSVQSAPTLFHFWKPLHSFLSTTLLLSWHTKGNPSQHPPLSLPRLHSPRTSRVRSCDPVAQMSDRIFRIFNPGGP